MSETVTQVLKPVAESIQVEPITKEFTLKSYDLVVDAKDEQIEAALGENHLFDKAEVYTIIGNLIAKQPEGEEGELLTNGRANIFYASSCVVSVCWDGSRWGVLTWHRGRWGAGKRVFSPIA